MQGFGVDKLFLKILFDGYDFLQGPLGRTITPDKYYKIVNETTYIKDISKLTNLKEFVRYCRDTYISQISSINSYIKKEIMNKYNVGLYNLEMAYDKNNPLYNNPYILFNQKQLNQLKKIYPNTELNSYQFWVCPSYNDKKEIDGIGFRITNTDIVKDSFKWIFLSGNNIIYGKDTVNKKEPCYIVEGFRDYVALKECNINCIGLGSVEISNSQKEFIDTLSNPILLLDGDSYGLKKSVEYGKLGYKTALLVNTKYKDSYDTWINNNEIKISNLI